MFTLLFACTGSDPDPGVEPVADRQVGSQVPLSSGCDDLDPARCWLPWPSFASTVPDDTTATGLRVEVVDEELPVEDDPRWLELADGFSRVSPALTAFPGDLDATSAATSVRMFDAGTGAEIPAHGSVISDLPDSLLMIYPRGILPASSEIVVVVADTLTTTDGAVAVGNRLDAITLGTAAPETQAEEDRRAWSAPIRSTLDAAGIDPAHVLRAWSFPTRSVDDPGRRLLSMFDDVDAADLSVTLTEVELGKGSIAAIVYGTVDGVPEYRLGNEQWLNFGDDGLPEAVGTRSAEFRIMIPAGKGDWPVALYGHGTGGYVTDSSFDSQLADRGVGKAGMLYLGWNGDDLINSVTWFSHVFDATSRSSSALTQSLADGHAILRALQGPLADALAADTIAGVANPAAGRRPIADRPIWVGGSLAGTMGAVIVAANEDIDTAVLNVPGAAWSHLIPEASLYAILVDPITHAWYPSDLDRNAALAMSQNIWDDVDGAAWEDPDSTLLLQESMGDPVLPNVGTSMLARARGAKMVGAPLDDFLTDLEDVDSSTTTAITQYATAFTDDYDIHGFAAEDGPAGDAAREQIDVFLSDWLAGEAPEIVLPSTCDPTGGCDFSE
jgi:hypothetical protein